MKILVTGAAGFIGAHCVLRLVQKEPGEGEEQVDIIMLTHLTLEKNIIAAIARIEGLPVNLGKVTRIRLEELAA